MSLGLGDELDDPGFKERRGSGGGGGRIPGVGSPSFGGVSSSFGAGGFGSSVPGGGALVNPGARRRLPGGWGAAQAPGGSLPAVTSGSTLAPAGWMPAPGAPGSISRGFSPAGGVPRPAAAPMGGPVGVGANHPAGGFDSSDPFGAPLAGGSETENLANWLIQQGGAGGAFSTEGPSGLMDAVRSRALSDANAGVQRAKTAASLYAGNDPTAAGYANLNAELNGQKGVSDALGDATLGRLGSQQDMYQWLLKNRIGFDQDWRSRDQGALLGRIGAGEQQRGSGGGFGGFLGDIAGRVIGGGLSPGGWFGGGR